MTTSRAPLPERIVTANDLAVRFHGATQDAIRDIALTLDAGERLLVLGPSGSGKTTLALALLGAIPQLLPAERRGEVTWPRAPAGAAPLVAGTGIAAATMQNADAQIVALTVEDEIAFALENRGLEPAEIERRIENALADAPGAGLSRKDATLKLSTGWRQRLALATALAEEPAALVIDEPVAHLDEQAAREAMRAVEAACGRGAAALLIEHRADHAAALADKLLVLDREGTPADSGPPMAVLSRLAARPDHAGLRLPVTVEIAAALAAKNFLRAPLAGLDADHLIAALGPVRHDPRVLPAVLDALHFGHLELAQRRREKLLLRVENADVRRAGAAVLHDVNFQVGEGEVVGVAGRNGAGKTTLALLAAGALGAKHGLIERASGRAPVYIPQNPAIFFATAALGLEAARRGLAWRDVAAELEAHGIAADASRHPLAHSHGELRRIALAFTLAAPERRLVALDEPTAGLDGIGLAALRADIDRLRARGCGVLIVAHDLDWLASVSDHILVLDDGRIGAEGSSRAILARALAGGLAIPAPPGAALAARFGWNPEKGQSPLADLPPPTSEGYRIWLFR